MYSFALLLPIPLRDKSALRVDYVVTMRCASSNALKLGNACAALRQFLLQFTKHVTVDGINTGNGAESYFYCLLHVTNNPKYFTQTERVFHSPFLSLDV